MIPPPYVSRRFFLVIATITPTNKYDRFLRLVPHSLLLLWINIRLSSSISWIRKKGKGEICGNQGGCEILLYTESLSLKLFVISQPCRQSTAIVCIPLRARGSGWDLILDDCVYTWKRHSQEERDTYVLFLAVSPCYSLLGNQFSDW